jgi:CheY-like chemotaxis protein
VQSLIQTGQKERPPVHPSGFTLRKLALTSRACGNCGSIDIRPSNRRNALDILLACVFLAPFRCRMCHDRFYRVWRRGLLNLPEIPNAPLLVMPVRRDPPPVPPVEPASIQSPVAVPDPPQEKPEEILTLAPQPMLASAPGPILILERDLSIRKLLRRLLERRGYAIEELEQAGNLASTLQDRGAGMLVVDTSAMEGNGVEALVALARANPSLKILALSTDSFEGREIPRRLLALPKPFSLDRFIECVDRLLERSNAATAGE